MRLHINNKGMSLIELIISMAITAIILSMIIMLISGASHSFRRTNDEVNLQMEAQIAINQLSAIAMGATKIDEVPSTPSDKKYIINGIAGKESYGVVYIDSVHKLYLIQKTPTVTVADLATVTDENNLLAEYVTSLEINNPTGSKTATISISFKLGEDTYSISKKVKIRNIK